MGSDVTELPKMPWTSIYLVSLELDVVHQGQTISKAASYTLYTTDQMGSNERISVINKKKQNALKES